VGSILSEASRFASRVEEGIGGALGRQVSRFASRAGEGIGGALGRLGGSFGSIVGQATGQAAGGLTEGVLEGLSDLLPPVAPVDPEAARRNLEVAIGQLPGGIAAAPDLAPITLGALPQLAGIERVGIGGPSGFRGSQEQLISQLQAQAAGTAGPSLAEQLLRSQQDRNLRQQMALAASLSGRALPAAQRQIMQQQAMGAQEALQQAALLRAQEQQQAMGMLGQTLGTARGQDVQHQQLELEAARANQAAAMQQVQCNKP
jgi:hypothetical protein